MNKKTIFTICVLLMISINVGNAKQTEIPKPILAIIGEAEGEPYIGKLAIACAIRNRGSLTGVYGLKSKRVVKHKYSKRILVDSTKAWHESYNSDSCEFIHGATHWEGIKFKEPYWARYMMLTATIGNHRMYKNKPNRKD